jgi:hypothetical protein
MNDTRTATVRTTVNGTILTGIIIAVAAGFGWTIEVADLAPYLPVLAAAIGVFYRLSLYLSERWPRLGYILFGRNTLPAYEPLPDRPAPPG